MNTRELREYLETNEINTENIEDVELENLYNTHKNHLIKTTGINPESIEERIYDISLTKFKFQNYIINDYPIQEIKSIKIDGIELDKNKYYTNPSSGIIRWKVPLYGETLEINYQKQIPEEIENLIETIVYDSILNSIDKKEDIKSIKEGDISITYETENNLSNTINKNIEKLTELYYTKPYSKMIR